MSRHGFWMFRIARNFASIQITLAITVVLVHMVFSKDLNSTTELIETTDLTNNKTISGDARGKKHPIFYGTLEGLEFALVPGWNVSDDFDNWVPPPDIQRIFSSYLSGFDNSGRPIWVHEIGKIDWPRYFEGTLQDQQEKLKCIRYVTWLGFKSKSLRSTHENPVTQKIVILDMEGFKAEYVTDPRVYRAMRKVAFGYKKYYEKYVKKMIVINVNFIAEIIINLFSRTQEKRFATEVEVYGTNRYDWGPKLTKVIATDQLPEWYGGKKGFRPVFVIG